MGLFVWRRTAFRRSSKFLSREARFGFRPGLLRNPDRFKTGIQFTSERIVELRLGMLFEMR